MLKITLHDSPGELRFQLEGRLSGAWVGELRQSWQTAKSTTRGRPTVVDMGDVDYVDPAGQELLVEMCRHDVRIKAVTPLIRTLVHDVEYAARCARVEEQPAQHTDAFVPSDPTARNSGAV